MIRRSGLMLKVYIPFLIQFILLITKCTVRGSDGLTQSELKAKYGQGIHSVLFSRALHGHRSGFRIFRFATPRFSLYP